MTAVRLSQKSNKLFIQGLLTFPPRLQQHHFMLSLFLRTLTLMSWNLFQIERVQSFWPMGTLILPLLLPLHIKCFPYFVFCHIPYYQSISVHFVYYVMLSSVRAADHHVTTRELITLQDPMEDNIYFGSQFGLDGMCLRPSV